MQPLRLRKAKIKDVNQIQALINHFAALDEMLPRSQSELYESLRDFFVIERKGEIVACGALHITWKDLAELKSLVVANSMQNQGLGKQIVTACLAEAKKLGINRVFALTYKPQFFIKLGFSKIDRALLPHKIWTECIKCVKFPDCNEVPVIFDLKRSPPSTQKKH
ncbi:MAG: N-acetyltransferase [bacterium]|nr:N-acetyltransferase [bacterium]